MIVYTTDIDLLYNGNSRESIQSPTYKEGISNPNDQWLYNPRRESLIEPPTTADNEKAQLNPDGTWLIVDDFRGVLYYEQGGTKKEITEIGELVPAGCLTSEPPTEFHTSHDGSEWIYDIDLAKETVTQQVEIEKRKALEDEKVIVDGIDVWNRNTKMWEVKNDVEVSTDDRAIGRLNKFYRDLSKNNNLEKDNWKNNGFKIKLNESSFDKIMDALGAEDDLIFDWVDSKLDEINDASNQADIEAINTNY